MTHKELLAEAVRNRASTKSSKKPRPQIVKLEEETVENLLGIAKTFDLTLTEKNEQDLREGRNLELILKDTPKDHLSREENIILLKKSIVVSAIERAKREKEEAISAQHKERAATRKVELAQNPEELAALKRNAEARQQREIQKADAKKISLQEALRNIDNINSIHSRLVSYGQEQLATRGKTVQKTAVSPQLLRKLVIQGVVPEGREMFELSSDVRNFKSAEQEQFNTFIKEIMPERERMTVKS